MERKPTRKRGRSPGTGGGTGQVQSLTRGLALLDRLAASGGGIALTDLAQQVGLPASTTHRLLGTLESMGYVVQRGDLGFWYVGVKAFEVGSAFLSTRDLVAQSHPHLRALVEQSGETANLAVLDDGEAVIVDQVQCQEMMRMLARLGSRAPAHASAVGKAMLAWLQDREITSILHRKGLIRLCQNTIDTPSRLRVELLEVRRRGFAVDDEEHAIGLRCAAAAIHDEHAEPIAAISVSGPKPRITDARLPELGALVAQAAQAITRSIGGRTPAA